MHELLHHSSRGRNVGAVACAILLAWAAVPAAAQSVACGDTIPLYSPSGMGVEFEVAPNALQVDGVRLRWDDLPDSLAGCSRLVIDPALQAELGVEVRGDYRNVFDRRIVFSFPAAGQIGDPDQTRVGLNVANDHLNPVAGDLSSVLNLSSAGGIYRMHDQGALPTTTQVNQGFPAHLGDVSIDAFTQSADGSVTYVAVPGVPVLRSYDDGQTWEEPLARVFPPFSQRMNSIVVFPSDPDRVWVGVTNTGIWESTDAGATWTQITPATIGDNSTVTTMKFLRVIDSSGSEVDRLYLAGRGQGLWYSDDEGTSFTQVGEFEVPMRDEDISPVGATCDSPVLRRVDVNDIEISPNDPALVYVGLARWGVYAGDTRDHSTWTPRFGELVLCGEDGDAARPFGEQRTVVEVVAMDLNGADVLFAGTEAQGSPSGVPDERSKTIMFESGNGGMSWSPTDNYPLTADETPYSVAALVADPRPGGAPGVIAATFGKGLWQKRFGASWEAVEYASGSGVRNPRTSSLHAAANGELLIGTSDSGIYQPGTWIDLTRALNRNAQSFEQVLQLGLQVRFTNPGVLQGGESFSVKAQNFRGYAVWRAVDFDRAAGAPVWELIGLLDLANPEACVEVTCDQLSQPIEVDCFANKRAHCFVPQLNDELVTESWEFFDRDVFNGYTYWYAVSTFDFGYTGETSPESFEGDMVFSPRWAVENEPASAIFTDLAGGQNYNGTLFQVNVDAVDVNEFGEIVEDVQVGDVEVYVVPNPLVRSAGWDRGDASSIRIVNVTASSKAEIYTIAGDLIREIENVEFAGEPRGNIEWDTRNEDGEPVASGVYIYRVTDDKGGEVVGRFTIVR